MTTAVPNHPAYFALRLSIPGRPKPYVRPGVDQETGQAFGYMSIERRKWRKVVGQAWRALKATHGTEIAAIHAAAGETGFDLRLTFCMPTADSKRWGRPHLIRPDADNLAKEVADALADEDAFAANGDATVSRIVSEKVWVPAANEGVIVELQAARHRDKSAAWPSVE